MSNRNSFIFKSGKDLPSIYWRNVRSEVLIHLSKNVPPCTFPHSNDEISHLIEIISKYVESRIIENNTIARFFLKDKDKFIEFFNIPIERRMEFLAQLDSRAIRPTKLTNATLSNFINDFIISNDLRIRSILTIFVFGKLFRESFYGYEQSSNNQKNEFDGDVLTI
jgi:hypothetical protein